MSDTDRIIETLGEHKGEMIAHAALMTAIARSLPKEILDLFEKEFAIELAIARTVLLNSSMPEAVLNGFESYVRAVATSGFRKSKAPRKTAS